MTLKQKSPFKICFSKVLHTLTLYSKENRALNFPELFVDFVFVKRQGVGHQRGRDCHGFYGVSSAGGKSSFRKISLGFSQLCGGHALPVRGGRGCGGT